ncbi:NAD-dependent protein lipoamidase sirtuin-4 [Physocladia obscura]|uniref:NAD-dependent protein lipoamidase sirtuin-4 n=1 Tax=Physocladia obscura TaxID=109957 RepID=A0AAD5T6R4_9FUNG|nr:NAD-dependent protein lipoamidase sirtuin-4 [Physocladia obscura]
MNQKIKLDNGPAAIAQLAAFIREANGRVAVLSGAGISTGSGIPDYRGPNGVYARNKDYKPIQYNQFVTSHSFRKKYWARSFLGWKQILSAQPNATHTALLSLRSNGWTNAGIITQNVDGLLGRDRILELHGTLHKVACISCNHEIPRSDFQQELIKLNPLFAEKLDSHKEPVAIGLRAPTESGKSNDQDMSNPDGDVEISWNYDKFEYPSCASCQTGVYKPDVVFFGENMRNAVRDESFKIVSDATHLLLVGTSLQVFSSFRLLKHAESLGHRIAAVNLGEFRGSEIPNIIVDASSDEVLPELVHALGEKNKN